MSPCAAGLLACALLGAGLPACERAPTVSAPEARTLGEATTAPTDVAPAGAPGKRGPRVVFLGDSISAGLHLPAHAAFPARLASALGESAQPFQLVNAGVSGDTSAGGLRRLPWLLKQKPDVVVVELGANDGLRGQPVAQIEANLRAILTAVAAANARALLLGMRIPPSYGEPYVSEFAAMYERVARDTGVAFVPFFMEGVAGVPALNLPDGIHPTAAGHERLAERLKGPLAALLGELGGA